MVSEPADAIESVSALSNSIARACKTVSDCVLREDIVAPLTVANRLTKIAAETRKLK
jgi:hypothetical protein